MVWPERRASVLRVCNEWLNGYIYVTLRIWIKSMFPFLNNILSCLQVQALLWNDIVKVLYNPVLVFSSSLVSMPCSWFLYWDAYFSGHTALFTVGSLPHKSVLHISLFFPYNAYLSVVCASDYLKSAPWPPIPSRFLLTPYYMLLTYLSGCDCLHVCYSMHTGSCASIHPSALY